MSSPPTSDVGFVQQGQVDWVAFGKTIVPLSIDVLARLQGAGVQPITYAGALQLTASFSLPERGQQRLWDAINRLKCYNGASNLLYFGFGHRSFFRILTETVSGLKCIALCSCVAEMHSETVAARILSALWHELGYPEDFEPSIPQFKALIKACGGSLASSPFPEIANRMFPSVKDLKADDRCSEPKDVAKALIGLFDISMGKTKSIAIVGGGDGAFIAAVAYWIFNMSIYVEDHDGNAIFSSSVTKRPVQPDSAQVYVKFFDLNKDHGIAISKSTYLLNDARDLIQYTPDKQLLHLRRRVPWKSCLKDTFGSAVDDFMKLPEAIWKFLGSFARISLALAEGEVDVGKYFRKYIIDFAEASYGQGFIDSSQILFPELAGANLRNNMQTVLPLPFSKAQAYQKESYLIFRRFCRCNLCNESTEAAPICFVVLATTLVNLIVTVSSLQFEVESPLYPTSHGIRFFYERNLEYYSYSLTGPGDDRFLLLFSYISQWYDDINLLGLLVEEVLILFTGTSFGGGKSLVLANKDSTSRLAVCGSGICVFVHGMVSISTRADLLRRIHVIPGRIGRKTLSNPDAVCREYDSVLEIANWPEPTVDRLQVVPASDGRPSTPTPSGQQSRNTSHSTGSKQPSGEILHQPKPNRGLKNLKLTPEVLEFGDAGEITFFYRISTSSGDILIPPGKVTTGILESTGLVSCKKSGDCRDCVNPPKLFTVESGWFMADEQAGKPDLPHWICVRHTTPN
ncbi:Ff.00g117350.m01.CDS01 [Fusarium sp. VM40]|nr:Ff.00g117350.m01.CDS01 [Fusarium sp. VM40]